MYALFGRDRTMLTHYRSGNHDFSTQSSNDISAHKLNAISVNFFSIRQLALLPLFARKVHILNWMIEYYACGDYSFYFHLASTISWKVLRNVEASKRQAEKIVWKQSGGYTSIFHFCNHHNISFLTFNFTQIVEARSISIVFFNKAEHFRELSVLGKRTGGYEGKTECLYRSSSQSEASRRAERLKYQATKGRADFSVLDECKIGLPNRSSRR